MVRRFPVPRLFIGDIPLDPIQARHARDVLRLTEGTLVELFTPEGHIASGSIRLPEADQVVVQVSSVTHQPTATTRIVVASAIPKGERADWMVEKLSELGVAAFIPLAADRSVTLPKGNTKFERWTRIATESAKQSRRAGVMTVGPLTDVDELIATQPIGYVLSTEPASQPIAQAINQPRPEILLITGPEGGWTDRELTAFQSAAYPPVRLTQTILRTETAAITAAAIVAVLMTNQNSKGTEA